MAEQVGRYPNIYTDTAGVRRFDYIVEAVKRGGPRKVLFGSDGPWLHPAVELHKIRVLGLSRQDEELILGGNILRLIRPARVGDSARISARLTPGLDGHRGALLASSDHLPPGAGPEYQLQSWEAIEWRKIELAASGSVVASNPGYNPVGNISNPWSSNGADLTNTVASSNPTPQSGVAYTVRHTPKSIVVTGGDVSQILVNGADVGSTAGAFKLGVGETITITYKTSAPATLVFAE